MADRVNPLRAQLEATGYVNPLRAQLEATGYVNPLRAQLKAAPPQHPDLVGLPKPVSPQQEQVLNAQREKKQGSPTVGQYLKQAVGGLNKAILDVADLPAELLWNAPTGLINTLAGTEIPKVGRVAESADFFQRATARAIPKGQDSLADAVYTGAEWGAGGLPAASRKLAHALPDIAAATGAIIGEQQGGETGEVIGGLTGMLAPTAARTAKAAITDGYQAARQMIDPAAQFDKPKPEPEAELAKQVLLENMADQPEALANLKAALARGEEGTLTDLTRDPNIGVAEAWSAGQGGATRQKLAQAVKQRQEQTKKEYLGEVGTAGPMIPAERTAEEALTRAGETVEARKQGEITTAAERAAEEKIEALAARRGAEQQALNAEQRSALLDDVVASSGRVDVSSKELHAAYKQLEAALKENLSDPAWKKFDEAAPIGTTALHVEIALALAKEDEATRRKLFSGEYGKLLGDIDKLEGARKPKELQGILSDIKAVNQAAKEKGVKGRENTALNKVSRIVDNYLERYTGDTFTQAKAATVQMRRELGGDTTAKALRGEPELLIDALNFKGAKGAVAARRVKQTEDPQVREAARKGLLDAINRDGISEKTLSPSGYGPALDEFPLLKKQVTEAVEARSYAKSAREQADKQAQISAQDVKETESILKESVKAAKTRASQREAKLKGLTLSKYKSQPKATIRAMLNKEDDTRELAALNNRLKREGGGEAFKTQVMTLLEERATGIVELESKEGRKLLADINRLEANGVFTQADIDVVNKAISRNEGRRLVQSGAMVREGKSGTIAADLASSAMAMTALQAFPASHQLMLGNTLKRAFKTLILQRKEDPDVVKRVNQFIRNPEAFEAALRGEIHKTESIPDQVELILRAIITGGRVTGEEVEE